MALEVVVAEVEVEEVGMLLMLALNQLLYIWHLILSRLSIVAILLQHFQFAALIFPIQSPLAPNVFLMFPPHYLPTFGFLPPLHLSDD